MHYLKHNLQTRFTHESITECGCTAESGSVEKEQTLPKMISCIYHMIPGSVKIHTRFDKLEPATRNNLD
jgi:hypothetical protein